MKRPARDGRGLAPRVLQSWIAPRRVVRSLSAMPEPVLMVVLLVAMLIFWLSQAPGHARDAALDPSVGLGARLAGSALAVMFLMPLVAYGLAQLVSLISRALPWRLTPHDSRLALFWALLSVSPMMLLSGLTAGFVGPGPALTLTRLLAGFGFLAIWAGGVAALVQPRRVTA